MQFPQGPHFKFILVDYIKAGLMFLDIQFEFWWISFSHIPSIVSRAQRSSSSNPVDLTFSEMDPGVLTLKLNKAVVYPILRDN